MYVLAILYFMNISIAIIVLVFLPMSVAKGAVCGIFAVHYNVKIIIMMISYE